MNNEISNKPCGCGNCEPMCTTCGRPWIVCKGECGCKKSCCCNKKVNFCEYGRMAKGCIREVKPECPMAAVIPSVVVDDKSNLKNLADCFVHVTSINTTFYIDDKHRMMITWAGPVEVDNYDVDENPLGLRSQMVYDFASDKGIYYNAVGEHKEFSFGENGSSETVELAVTLDESGSWENLNSYGAVIDQGEDWYLGIVSNIVPVASLTNTATGETVSLEAAYNLLESGKKVILNNVPVGRYYKSTTGTYTDGAICDKVELGNKSTITKNGAVLTSYGTTVVAPYSIETNQGAVPLEVFILKDSIGGEDDEYMLVSQGFRYQGSPAT